MKHIIYVARLYSLYYVVVEHGRLSIGTVMVFKGENGYDHCHWCHYLTCVPTSRWKCDGSWILLLQTHHQLLLFGSSLRLISPLLYVIAIMCVYVKNLVGNCDPRLFCKICNKRNLIMSVCYLTINVVARGWSNYIQLSLSRLFIKDKRLN